MEFNGPITWFHPSGSFRARPSVEDTDGTLSGILLRQENFFIDSAIKIDLGASLTIINLNHDGFPTSVAPVPIAQNIKLYPRFSYFSFHSHSSPPSAWYVLLRKNSVDAASGVIQFSEVTNGGWYGHTRWLEGVDDANIIFRVNTAGESTDQWSMYVHNDGSGTVIDSTIAMRVQIGFTILDNDAD